ncbi:ESPR-type extended signal peptide-containing protein, partial [Acinetobacter puyangensis]|uniref:ESPR-type extended signal peptide-containing protein n=1 Tax=Acinetobacter puyangensis TaxID=1096779 RepID=UPI003A4E0058
MNHVFKKIWNKSLGRMVVVSENAKSAGKTDNTTGTTTNLEALTSHPVTLKVFGLQTIVLSITIITGGNVWAEVCDADGSAGTGGSTAIGSNAFACGNGNVASGIGSTAVGSGKKAHSVENYNHSTSTLSFGDFVVITNQPAGSPVWAGDGSLTAEMIVSINGQTNLSDAAKQAFINYATGTWSAKGNQASHIASSALGVINKASGLASSAVGFNNTASGDASAAYGASNQATAQYSSVFGSYSLATAEKATALGYDSLADEANTISVGQSGAEKRITNVANAVKGTDAVNLRTAQSLLAGGGITGAVLYDTATSEQITLAGGTGGTKITNLKNATLSDISTDAVTGQQLFATNEAVALKADQTAVDAGLALKASKTELTDGLATKASQSDLSTGLATTLTSAKDYADTGLALKADQSALTTGLANTLNDAKGYTDQQTANMVVYDSASKDTITLQGGIAGTKITNLQNATLSDTSTDAVTGQQLNATNTRVGQTETGLTAANTEIGKLDGRVDQTESDIGTLQTDLGAAQGDISALDTRVGTTETNITDLRTDLTTTQGDVTDLRTDLTTTQGDVTALDGRVDQTESDIGTLQTDLGAAQGDISALDTRVGTTETNITDL